MMQAPACYLVRNAGIAGSQQASITTLEKMDVRQLIGIKIPFFVKPASPLRVWRLCRLIGIRLAFWGFFSVNPASLSRKSGQTRVSTH